jgi:hypothetical protein
MPRRVGATGDKRRFSLEQRHAVSVGNIMNVFCRKVLDSAHKPNSYLLEASTLIAYHCYTSW